MVVACYEAGVEVAACSEAKDEAVVCSEPEIKYGRRWRDDGV
jgi:hypothetical protein